MPEFRYIGINARGKPVQGTVHADNRLEAKRRISELASELGFSIRTIQRRATYWYKVRRHDHAKPIRGEQKAFSKEELETALVRMGYQVLAIRRKLFELPGRVPTGDIVVFMRICADLLREKIPYDDVLTLAAHDLENRQLREAIREIQKDLRLGKEGKQVYGKHDKVLGRFTAHMMALASTSGSMVEIYQNTAKFLERNEALRKNIRSVIYMPTVVLISIILTTIFYVVYIFPKLTEMLVRYDIPLPPMTKATMDLGNFLQNNSLWLLLGAAVPVVALVHFLRTERGRYLRDKWVLKIPVIGPMLHKMSIEMFCRIFHAMYGGSGENISVIRTASESCRNTYIEKEIKNIVLPLMLKEGRGFVESLEKTKVFPRTALHRLRTGEESGTIREAAAQLADYYERETTYRMTRIVEWINLTVSIIVTLMIVVLTLISSEIGFIQPPSPFSK
jgi:type IV pilus assembly protein PilC